MIVTLEGRYLDAAIDKPSWQADMKAKRDERRSFQFVADPDRIGAMGEAALCQYLGIDPSVEMFKHDPALPDVRGIEVKTVTKRHYCLLIRDPKPATLPHVLAFDAGDGKTVDLLGWATPQFINTFPLRTDRGHPPARFIPPDRLNTDLRPLREAVA
jgi:hypothetical protein